MNLFDCAECGAPAVVESTSFAAGTDFDGSSAVFALEKVRCATGHWYTQVNENDSIKVGREEA